MRKTRKSNSIPKPKAKHRGRHYDHARHKDRHQFDEMLEIHDQAVVMYEDWIGYLEGQIKSLEYYCEQLGFPVSQIIDEIDNGASVEQAMNMFRTPFNSGHE